MQVLSTSSRIGFEETGDMEDGFEGTGIMEDVFEWTGTTENGLEQIEEALCSK